MKANEKTDYLQVGKIVNTHGIKGEVKVIPLTDDPERFHKLKWVFLEKNSKHEKVDIESLKFIKSTVIVKLKGIDDMTAAEGLKETYMLIDREHAVKLPKDSFFIFDLIGCEVFNDQGEKLGILSNILKTGSNDVYVVKGEDKELLVPALKSVVKDISIEDKKIVVTLPEGLV
jgi:16S rRNA processing protein RimM